MGRSRKPSKRRPTRWNGHSKVRNLDRFIALTKKYADIPELTPTIVNEFIKEIVVYEYSDYRKSRTQEIRIVFNFLDETEYLARESKDFTSSLRFPYAFRETRQ